jgi:hypothetical protein
MGELIVFYVPASFKPVSAKWIPPSERGKLIDFQTMHTRKSA